MPDYVWIIVDGENNIVRVKTKVYGVPVSLLAILQTEDEALEMLWAVELRGYSGLRIMKVSELMEVIQG